MINSERALQACVVEALAPLAPEIVTLVEPTLTVRLPSGASKVVVPDLLIGCPELHRLVAVLELKFVPHHYPQWEKDFDSLGALLQVGGSVRAFDIDPTTGEDRKRMTPDATTLGIFAAIGRHDSWAISPELVSQARQRLPDGVAVRLLHATGSVHPGHRPKFEVAWFETADSPSRQPGSIASTAES